MTAREGYVACLILGGSIRHFDVAFLWKFSSYGRTYGLHNNFVKGKKISLRVKAKFWSILLLLFYLEGIYVPTLQQQAHLWQLNYCLNLFYSNVPSWLLLSFAFKIGKQIPFISALHQGHFLFSPYMLVRARPRTNRSVPLVDKAKVKIESLIRKSTLSTFSNPIMLFVCPPKILHDHCLQFLLGHEDVPREIENNACANLWGHKQRVLWYFPKWPVASWRAIETWPGFETVSKQRLAHTR